MADGTITAQPREGGLPRLEVDPGTLQVSFSLLAEADPEWLEIRDGLVIFRGEDDGRAQVFIYRPTTVVPGHLVCEPVS